ncbi:MAG: hypothetical protein ACRD0K_28310 [Egibacteraceae bacterium]
MNIAVLVLLCLLGAIVFILLGALVELFKQVQQIRTHLDLVDRPSPLDLGKLRGELASAVGLPASLDDAEAAMVLFLSNACATCRSIAAALRGAVPQTLWIVVEPVFRDDADLFVEEFQLHGARTLVDQHGRIAGLLGLDITPSAIFIENGRMRRAQTVPSSRQLLAALPLARPLKPSQPVISP